LRGYAYGRTYNETLTFIRKEKVPVPEHIVEKLQEILSQQGINDPKYREMISTQEQALFKTDNGIEVMVSPRYVGSILGNDDDGRGNTICALSFDGEYVALALYNESEREIVAHEY
jgi:hypothetical protein